MSLILLRILLLAEKELGFKALHDLRDDVQGTFELADKEPSKDMNRHRHMS